MLFSSKCARGLRQPPIHGCVVESRYFGPLPNVDLWADETEEDDAEVVAPAGTGEEEKDGLDSLCCRELHVYLPARYSFSIFNACCRLLDFSEKIRRNCPCVCFHKFLSAFLRRVLVLETWRVVRRSCRCCTDDCAAYALKPFFNLARASLFTCAKHLCYDCFGI